MHMDNSSPKVVVLGAGVVGLTVARIFQSQLRKANVTILADKFNVDTTSSVAAGIFTPRSSFKGKNEETTKRWIKDSWDYWYDILKSPDASVAGVTQLSTYIFSKRFPNVVKNDMLEGLVPLYRKVTQNELNLCGGGWKYGSFYTTMLTSCNFYQPWAEKEFVQNGGKIVSGKINNFSELKGYDLVFNCTGLGAKFLCNDNDMVPLRGQVIKVKAPWIKTAFYGEFDTYIIPGMDGTVTLGGTRQYDSYNLDVCKHDAAAILERCSQLLPALKKSEIVSHKVGLRPHRSPVRVEPELYSSGSANSLKLIHCYGHGGYGVTMAPGTAINAVNIGLDLLRSNMKHKL